MLTIKRLAYELYKIDWLRRIAPEQMIKTYKEYYYLINEEEMEDYTFNDYIFENGYGGELYACFDEFAENEYLDKDYIKELFGDENLYKEYLDDIGQNPERKNHRYFKGFLPKYILVFAKPGTRDVHCQSFGECIESGTGEETYFATTMKKLIKLWEERLRDHQGRWCWIFVDEECVCSGAMDSNDREILEQYVKGAKGE